MNTSILVLLALLVIFYVWVHHGKKKSEAMTMLRYRPFMTGTPASIDYNENIAGIPDYDSTAVLPNVNQYANDLAFNPNNPESAHLMQNGRPIMDQKAVQIMGNRDGDVNGRN